MAYLGTKGCQKITVCKNRTDVTSDMHSVDSNKNGHTVSITSVLFSVNNYSDQ